MADDLETKLAVIREQTRQKQALQEERHQGKRQEIQLQNELKQANFDNSLEVIQLKHDLDPEVRERDRADTVFYKNIDLIEFIKTQQVRQNHLLEEIHHTTLSSILEKAILMILSSQLDNDKHASSHEHDKDKLTHQTTQQIRLEQFKTDLNRQYGTQTTDEIMELVKQYQGEFDDQGTAE